MLDTEKSNATVSIMGTQRKKRNTCSHREWTLDKVTAFIKKKEYQPKVEEGLIKLLRSYPHGAYEHFIKNIDQLLQRVKQEIFLSED